MLEAQAVPSNETEIQAAITTPVAAIQVLKLNLQTERQISLRDDTFYRLDLSVTPRLNNARLCFAERWPRHRFERPGSLFLTPPGETLIVRSGVGHQATVLCCINAQALSEWLDEDIDWTDNQVEATFDINSGEMRNLIAQLGQEACDPGLSSKALIEAKLLQIGVNLQRYFAPRRERSTDGGLSPRNLRLIEERLRDIDDAPSISELADICRMSVRQLSRAFKASRSMTIGDYVAHSTIEKARLLLTERQSVKSVAFALGFSSSASFCHAFKKATGMTPGQFRALQMN